MRTNTQLALVLMGGGALTAGVAVSAESWRACQHARLAGDPSAETLCQSSKGIGYWHGGGWSRRRVAFADTEGARSVARGGFGFFGMHFGGFHG